MRRRCEPVSPHVTDQPLNPFEEAVAAAPTAATAATGDADQEIHGDENEIFQDPGVHADEVQEPGEDEVIDSDAEGEIAKVARDPKMPSEAEVEAHRAAGHWPFRCWCVHCMAASGLGMPHRTPEPRIE